MYADCGITLVLVVVNSLRRVHNYWLLVIVNVLFVPFMSGYHHLVVRLGYM